MRDADRRPPLAGELVQPWPAAALALLLVNDHALKGADLLPGWLTGKLSDFAGLFLFPIVLFVLADGLGRIGRQPPRTDRRRLAVLCGAATAVVFAALKLDPACNAAANALWGAVVLDPSDLVALPMCALSASWLARGSWRSHADAAPRALRTAVALLACFGCVATGSMQKARRFPEWKLLGRGERAVGCADVDTWVSKSGKQGMGVTVWLRANTTDPCRVRVESARFEIAGRKVAALQLPEELAVAADPRHVYLAFAFDNQAAWNRNELHAVLDLQLIAGNETQRVRRPLLHSWPSPHHHTMTAPTHLRAPR